jgi:hypothetical protein
LLGKHTEEGFTAEDAEGANEFGEGLPRILPQIFADGRRFKSGPANEREILKEQKLKTQRNRVSGGI